MFFNFALSLRIFDTILSLYHYALSINVNIGLHKKAKMMILMKKNLKRKNKKRKPPKMLKNLKLVKR